jgi:uncharacterized alkaline shock family protein YloU
MSNNRTAVQEPQTTGAVTEGLTLMTDKGLTTVADDVVAKLAGHACREVEGVAKMGNSFRRLIGRARLNESLAQGVNVEVGKRECAIDLVIVVRYGQSIPELAAEVRANVISRIESATGLLVKEVNLEIDDVEFAEDVTSARVE